MTRKGTVNPFEPWRPVEVHVPPPVHAGRPWRPPPPPRARVAVEEPPRNQPPERPKRPEGQGGQASPGLTPISQSVVIVVLGAAGLLLLVDSVGPRGFTHLPRLMALGASAGLFAGMALNHRRSWYARLTGMAIALAFAGIALWFVPSSHGVNLWSVYRQIEELRTLPAGDVAEYQRGAAARRTLVEEYPALAEDVRAAEQSWLRRTVDEAIENADRQSKNDPHAALAYLFWLDKDLLGVEHYYAVRNELDTARRRTLEACAKAVRREADDLLGRK